MSSNVLIAQSGLTAPTPQNTPLTHAPIAAGLSRPTVPDITEDNEGEEEQADSPVALDAATMQAAMFGMVQGRLASLVGKSSGYIEALPAGVKRNVEALKGVQVKQTELQNRYKHECLELEKKYLELQKPLYERRHAIVTGKALATSEEVAAGEAQSLKDDPEHPTLPAGVTSDPSGIPEFWLTALRNYIGLADIITDRDADALKHLLDIRISYIKEGDKPGFKLSFVFSPNDFFENEVLEKTYLYQEEVGYSGDFVYDRAIGTEIKWKEEKDLTKEFEIKKQRNKNTNRTRLVRKARPTESFFNFFTPPPSIDEDAEIDDDDLEEIEQKLETDYQIGEDLKEKIIPRAVDYFTGKALEYEVLDEDDDDFEDLDEDEDEDGFDDDDSDSDADLPARRRGPPKRPVASSSSNVNPEECKQQ